MTDSAAGASTPKSDDPSGGGAPPVPAGPVAPAVPRKSWQDGVGPAYIALFLSVVFLDRLAPGTLLVGGLGPSAVGAVLAGLVGYWGLYYAPALWGVQTRRPLAETAASTFGGRGAAWVPGVLLGLIAIPMFAATIDAATRWSLSGLVAAGMLDPKHLEDSTRGGWVAPRALFLFVAASWTITSAVIGTLAVRLVAAIMIVYPIFPAVALGLALVWALPTVTDGPVAAAPFASGGLRAVVTMAQFVFSFLAANALAAGDWGAATRSPRDARLGGLVGVTCAAPTLAILALLIVAGARGRGREVVVPAVPWNRAIPGSLPRASPPEVATLRDVFLDRVGGRLGTTALFVMALALLGPACFTPFVIARQFSAAWPEVPRWAWSLAGALGTWPLIASGLARRTDLVFGVVGAFAAPVAGAMAADYALGRGRWPGPRLGLNLAGLIAWALGAAVGILPYVGFPRVQPASLFAFVAAFAAYPVLAALGLQARPAATDGAETPSGT